MIRWTERAVADLIAVGEFNGDVLPPISESGMLYVYERDGSSWTTTDLSAFETVLRYAGWVAGDEFADTIALSGNGQVVVAGADSKNVGTGPTYTNAGVVYIYR